MTRSVLVFAFALTLLASARSASAGPEHAATPLPESHGRIGIQVQPMTPELREHMKAPADAGVLVVRVEEDSPAAAAGVEVGDVVVRAGGEAVDEPHELIVRVAQVAEGEKLALELVRDGRTLTLDVAPRGTPAAADVFERFIPGRFHHGVEALEQRLDQLEKRIEELERRTPEQKPT
jgi:serine protease Do